MSDFDPDKVRLSTGHFINGQFVSASGKTMGIKRPSDGQHYADINEAGAETVGEAVSLAEDARIRSGWSSCSPPGPSRREAARGHFPLGGFDRCRQRLSGAA